jgi:serine/threonine protein kinase
MLGPYEVENLLGAGGMGEVYRARDTRLSRTVAIKTLLSDITATSALRARFEREARAISALSNPHICALYDVGHADGIDYLVMEYIEGETLADRIARGRLPLSQVLRYGTEIAVALQHAHRAGITHRDLKPGNVMLTSSGVKLLDFGLARLAEPERVFSDDSAAPTIANPITAEGMIVGTMVYMSPEQLEGRAVDHRSDIFSLGCVLYEMATGQRPFGGGSRAAISAAILSSDPLPPRSLQPALPAALERIVLTALEKSPEDRWQTAHDVARQLRWLSESSSASDVPVPISAPPAHRWLLFALPFAAAILGGLLVWGSMRLSPPNVGRAAAIHLHFSPPDIIIPIRSYESAEFALSPDGRTICFLGSQKGKRSLFLRRLDSYEVRKLEGSDEGGEPFWSPDGEWIGFNARGKLWKTKIDGKGVPEFLCDIEGNGAIGSWQANTILFADRPGGRPGIYRIPDRGGTAVQVTTLKKGEWRHSWPRMLPDGHHFLYQAGSSNSIDRHLIYASIDSPETTELLKNVSEATLLSQDHLAYVRDGKLVTQRFDPKKGAILGDPVLIADNVSYFYPSATAAFDAANGTIVYRTDTSTGRLVMTDRKGTERVIDDRNLFSRFSASISPDGKRAAVTVLDHATQLGDIWLYDLARGGSDRFTNEPGLALTPVWSPDGRSIIYSQAAAGTYPRLVRRGLTASRSEDLLPPGTFQFGGSFSPDGGTFFFTREVPLSNADIYRLDMRTHQASAVLDTTFDEADPQLSPDGKWLAFTSNANGTREVFLQSAIGSDSPRVRISTTGGDTPRWRGDGHELFYLSPQKSVISVVPRVAGDWRETTSAQLFRAPDTTLTFAPSQDGQSFLFVHGSSGASDAFFHVIVGWE